LVAAIQDDFPAPIGFLKTREQAKSELRVITTPIDTAAQSRSLESQDRIRAQESVVATALDQQFDTFWDGLSEPEREEFERQAFDHAEPFNQRFYVERKQEGGILFKTIRRTILLAELMRRTQLAE
jgi:hypothetical protein